MPTNKNLDDLLDRHFGLTRAECYLTNVFPFLKPGGISARIARKDYDYCAKQFTVPEIQIVRPRLVICLGKETFDALRRASGQANAPNMPTAIEKSAFKEWGTRVHCVAHTGARGRNNRGREQVEKDWQRLAETFAPDLQRTARPARGGRDSHVASDKKDGTESGLAARLWVRISKVRCRIRYYVHRVLRSARGL